MSNIKNDDKILELKKQIKEKREKVEKIQSFKPVTTCSIRLHGESYNLHVSSLEVLIPLLITLNSYRLSALDLGLSGAYKISGFCVEDWIKDINARIISLDRKEEERKLKLMEDKLSDLLSNEKKVELELEEIANLLK